jgi:anaerobic dimethyl sulfoxide reductase subunit A
MSRKKDRFVCLAEIKALFVFFGDVFLHSLSREKWNLCPASLTGASSLCGALSSFGELSAILNSASDREWDEFDAEYRDLFSGIRPPSPALWESCYRSEDGELLKATPGSDRPNLIRGRLLNSVTLGVATRYREAGLSADEAEGQPPDHIGTECVFFAWLCGKAEKNPAGKRPERVFFDLHLRGFAAAFSVDLEKHAAGSAFKTLARALREAVEFLSDARWIAPKEYAMEDMEPPGGLRFLTEEEARERAKERRVPICGLNNCGGRCPLVARVVDGCVLELCPGDATTGRSDAPPIKACARGFAYHRTFLSDARLRYPMKRTGERGEGRFTRISWDEAAATIAGEIKRVRTRYGPQSRYVNYSTGVAGVARGDFFARNLLALDGGFLDRYNDYSAACTSVATPFTYGTGETGNSARDLLNSRLIILWGHNPLETVFGSSLNFYLTEAKKRGIEIIAVDPRRSDTTAVLADRWIGLRPTTDGALMDAAAFTILNEGLQDQAFMDRFCIGFDRAHMPPGMEDRENYGDYVFGKYDGTPKSPEWAEKITGVDADTIEWLARKYAKTKPAALLQGYGPQRHGNGEQFARSGTLLACLTGNVGISGGAAGGYGKLPLPAPPAIASVPNPYKGVIPAFLWTDAIVRGPEMTSLRDGVRGVEKLDVGVKMIFNLAGNALINQHSDVNRTARILRDTDLCEFIVCSDLFMTPSAKFADILLPGTSLFEGENMGTPWREGDCLLYCDQSTTPLFECRFEYDWLSDVARELGCYDAFTRGGQSVRGLLEEGYSKIRAARPDMPDFEAFRKRGAHYYESPRFVAFEANVRDFENHPFPTPSGKIEIFSPRLHALNNPSEIPAIPKYVPSFEGPEDPLFTKYPLQLIGWHTRRRTHSIHDNNPAMDRLEPQKLWIHPADAGDRNIRENDQVEVFNDRGRIRIRAHLTDRIVRGVLAIPQGGWHTLEAGVDVRGCINTLSTARPTPLAKGNPQHSNLVEAVLFSSL